MAIIYRLTQNDEGNQDRILRIDGDVRTCFKADGTSADFGSPFTVSEYKKEYDLWLAEGNTPEPADS
jgi:hypothetical protein|tara:strand:+ start:406 stop:606 length:201 start_codon:yes stop_codon:yes gene_type:complete